LIAQVAAVRADSRPSRLRNASTLVGRTNVWMADQVDIPHRLDAHHPDQNFVDFISPECSLSGM
jgi:hypothetical protein